jgi:superfamily II DNA or RNA helicase
MNIYETRECRIFEREYVSQLRPHQNACLTKMISEDKMTICMPTGTGKSRVIYADMLDHLKAPTFDTFVIASHRLLLNVQHFNELFSTFEILATKIGFIFVGSGGVDLSEFQKNLSLNAKLAQAKVNYPDLISTCSSASEIFEKVAEHHQAKRDVIIISTYHSLHKLNKIKIHTLYCDEAHFLATPAEITLFKTNFEKVSAKRTYFFTATPKDYQGAENLLDENLLDVFLMNNEDIFGKRHDLTFKEAIEDTLIVKPYIHLIEVKNFKETKHYLSPKNYASVVLDAFSQHSTTIKDPTKCNSKLLVKCPSVELIWKIKKEIEKTSDITVFAGASYNPDGPAFWKGKSPVKDKNKFLLELQRMENSEQCIILHYDILSEGIDVPGITGVMFLSKELPTRSKILQTIGRSTRLLVEDRKAIYSSEIGKNDYNKMIKPHCAVILPILSVEMKHSSTHIAKLIIDLRENLKFEPGVKIAIGEDNSKGGKDTLVDALNQPEEKAGKFSSISTIKHYIELYDQEKVENLQREEIQEMMNLRFKNETEFIEKFSEFLLNN